MDLIFLLDSVNAAAAYIDRGRKGFATRGKAEEGRVSYERGISMAMSAFKDAQSTIDPYIVILVEYSFLTQELQICDKTDKDTINSLTKAIQSFDDTFLALKTVVNSALYQGAESTYPHDDKYRAKGFPKDAFHVACNAHKTRINNILRTPGLDSIEKTLLKQRFANLSTAQNAYLEKQKLSLGKE